MQKAEGVLFHLKPFSPKVELVKQTNQKKVTGNPTFSDVSFLLLLNPSLRRILLNNLESWLSDVQSLKTRESNTCDSGYVILQARRL